MLLHHDPNTILGPSLLGVGVLSTVVGAVIAQVVPSSVPDGIPSSATWIGTGLVSSILAWLFFWHLPSKDKQIVDLISGHDQKVKDLIDSHNERIKEITADFRTNLIDMSTRWAEQDKERRKDYRESLTTVVNHCEKETANTSRAIQQTLAELGPLIHALRPIVEELRQNRQNGGRQS